MVDYFVEEMSFLFIYFCYGHCYFDLIISGSLPAECILKVKRRVFEDAGSCIAACLETHNGEIVFLVKTEYDTCKIYIFDEHLLQIQNESAPIGSRNLMT